MKTRYILDTTALISYFSDIFRQNSRISLRALNIINESFIDNSNTLVSIPSIVLVEIFDVWYRQSSTQEFRAKLKALMINKILEANNIEIREIDDEIIENFLYLYDDEINLENRDRIILASAYALEAKIITSDRKIIRYLTKHSSDIEFID